MTTRAQRIAELKAEASRLEVAISDLSNPDAGAQLDDLAQRYMLENPSLKLSYLAAFEHVRKLHPGLSQEYGEQTNAEFAQANPKTFASKE